MDAAGTDGGVDTSMMELALLFELDELLFVTE